MSSGKHVEGIHLSFFVIIILSTGAFIVWLIQRWTKHRFEERNVFTSRRHSKHIKFMDLNAKSLLLEMTIQDGSRIRAWTEMDRANLRRSLRNPYNKRRAQKLMKESQKSRENLATGTTLPLVSNGNEATTAGIDQLDKHLAAIIPHKKSLSKQGSVGDQMEAKSARSSLSGIAPSTIFSSINTLSRQRSNASSLALRGMTSKRSVAGGASTTGSSVPGADLTPGNCGHADSKGSPLISSLKSVSSASIHGWNRQNSSRKSIKSFLSIPREVPRNLSSVSISTELSVPGTNTSHQQDSVSTITPPIQPQLREQVADEKRKISSSSLSHGHSPRSVVVNVGANEDDLPHNNSYHHQPRGPVANRSFNLLHAPSQLKRSISMRASHYRHRRASSPTHNPNSSLATSSSSNAGEKPRRRSQFAFSSNSSSQMTNRAAHPTRRRRKLSVNTECTAKTLPFKQLDTEIKELVVGDGVADQPGLLGATEGGLVPRPLRMINSMSRLNQTSSMLHNSSLNTTGMSMLSGPAHCSTSVLHPHLSIDDSLLWGHGHGLHARHEHNHSSNTTFHLHDEEISEDFSEAEEDTRLTDDHHEDPEEEDEELEEEGVLDNPNFLVEVDEEEEDGSSDYFDEEIIQNLHASYDSQNPLTNRLHKDQVHSHEISRDLSDLRVKHEENKNSDIKNQIKFNKGISLQRRSTSNHDSILLHLHSSKGQLDSIPASPLVENAPSLTDVIAHEPAAQGLPLPNQSSDQPAETAQTEVAECLQDSEKVNKETLTWVEGIHPQSVSLEESLSEVSDSSDSDSSEGEDDENEELFRSPQSSSLCLNDSSPSQRRRRRSGQSPQGRVRGRLGSSRRSSGGDEEEDTSLCEMENEDTISSQVGLITRQRLQKYIQEHQNIHEDSAVDEPHDAKTVVKQELPSSSIIGNAENAELQKSCKVDEKEKDETSDPNRRPSTIGWGPNTTNILPSPSRAVALTIPHKDDAGTSSSTDSPKIQSIFLYSQYKNEEESPLKAESTNDESSFI